jgi:hypothetical protein
VEVLLDYVSELNWLAVVVATLVSFGVGATWYSQSLFGKAWMKSIGLKESDTKKANMARPIILTLVGTFVAAVAMGVLVQVLALTSVWQGATFGIMIAVAFLATNKVMQAQFELRPLSYNVITSAADVVTLGLMGAILAVWR